MTVRPAIATAAFLAVAVVAIGVRPADPPVTYTPTASVTPDDTPAPTATIPPLPASPLTPEPPAVVAPRPPAPVLPILSPASGGVLVIASWYGPSFFGNTTACGQLYTPAIQGVAHKTLPCGTRVTLAGPVGVVTVPVIDRGPYIPGRTFDLSSATRASLACSDLCTVRWLNP